MVFIPDERHLCHPFYVKTIKELKVNKILCFQKWWAQVDLNHRPPRYQHGALTN